MIYAVEHATEVKREVVNARQRKQDYQHAVAGFLPTVTGGVQGQYACLAAKYICCIISINVKLFLKFFNSDNQLSSNLATQVFQDSNGFIWIATRNGLSSIGLWLSFHQL